VWYACEWFDWGEEAQVEERGRQETTPNAQNSLFRATEAYDTKREAQLERKKVRRCFPLPTAASEHRHDRRGRGTKRDHRIGLGGRVHAQHLRGLDPLVLHHKGTESVEDSLPLLVGVPQVGLPLCEVETVQGGEETETVRLLHSEELALLGERLVVTGVAHLPRARGRSGRRRGRRRRG